MHFAGVACFVFFGSGAISRLKAVKNAKNEMNARHIRKPPPQFTFVNEERPQAVLCFLVGVLSVV